MFEPKRAAWKQARYGEGKCKSKEIIELTKLRAGCGISAALWKYESLIPYPTFKWTLVGEVEQYEV